jgi:hypothetical protein
MPTLGDLKQFLMREYDQCVLPSNPSLLFSPDFLQHLCAFVDGPGQHSCERCDAVVAGLSKAIAVWARRLCHQGEGGAR